jgi:hypothetical protein
MNRRTEWRSRRRATSPLTSWREVQPLALASWIQLRGDLAISAYATAVLRAAFFTSPQNGLIKLSPPGRQGRNVPSPPVVQALSRMRVESGQQQWPACRRLLLRCAAAHRP